MRGTDVFVSEWQVWLEASYQFNKDETLVYIRAKTHDGAAVVRPMQIIMTDAIPFELNTVATEPMNPSLVLPNDLGRTLHQALNVRYGTPKPEIDWETHYREVCTQRDHWKALYESLVARNE